MIVAKQIIEDLTRLGYTDCFALAGGASAHLLDALQGQTKIRVHFMLHEQSCTMAADAYFRFYGRPAIVLVTNGPGVSNTVTGVLGAFQDSVPMFCISGQVPRRYITEPDSDLRQTGVQESLSENLLGSIVKSFVRPNSGSIHRMTDNLHTCSMSGRMGPVWLEVPLDVQSLDVVAVEEPQENVTSDPKLMSRAQIRQARSKIMEGISRAKRPLVVIGNGINLSGTRLTARKFLRSLGIPVVSTWSAADIFAHDDPLYVGNFGILGERAANIAIQSSDYLLILGSRLSIPNIGYETGLFSPRSFKAMVDIDEAELSKTSIDINLKVLCDLESFFGGESDSAPESLENRNWLPMLADLNHELSLEKEDMSDSKDGVDAYRVIGELSHFLEYFDAVVTDMGSSFTVTMQALKRNGTTRVLTSSGTSSMGFGLPGALGIALANPKMRVLCIAGDGGLQMNIQELHTMADKTTNLKLLVLDSNGYLAISLMQDNIFNGRYIGSTPKSGVSAPNFERILNAYGLTVSKSSSKSSFPDTFMQFIKGSTRALIVRLPSRQVMRPRVQTRKLANGSLASPSLDFMWPEISLSTEWEQRLFD